MNNHERERLIEVFNAMSREELEVLAERIPWDLVVKRVYKDMKQNHSLQKSISNFSEMVGSIQESYRKESGEDFLKTSLPTKQTEQQVSVRPYIKNPSDAAVITAENVKRMRRSGRSSE